MARKTPGNFKFKFFCTECQAHMVTGLSKEPIEVTCPKGHSLGLWSDGGTKERRCTICGFTKVLHVRVRHDKAGANGQQIQVNGTSEELKAVFDHMMTHPEVVDACVKAGLVKVKK